MNTKFSKHLVQDCKTCARASTCPFKRQQLETPKFRIAYSVNAAMLEFKLISYGTAFIRHCFHKALSL